MKRFLITTVTAISIATTSISASATPARAGGSDVAEVLGALALFAIIAAGVEHERNAEKKKQHTTKPRVVRQPVALPGRCVRRLENNQGTRRVVARGCLERHYAAAGSLPRYCATRFKNARGNTRKGYDLRCLRSDGYRVIR
ncbi:hypothetical protein [Nereida ignava]|uniref:hypothetical protein n=1 Tax=Nereida ignava TaxID=282199 RepID=UPI0030F7F81E